MGGRDRDPKAPPGENRRRWEIAEREFEERIRNWTFILSPDAEAWAEAWAPTIDKTNLVTLVEQAGTAGLFLTPEPGTVRNEYSYRDPDTEATTGEGFGFWPASAECLVIDAAEAVTFAELPGLDALGVLRRVVDTFQAPRSSYKQK